MFREAQKVSLESSDIVLDYESILEVKVDFFPLSRGVCKCLVICDLFFDFDIDFWATKSDLEAIKIFQTKLSFYI